MSQDKREWIAGRVELMLSQTRELPPEILIHHLRTIITQGVSDTLDIHTETLTKELERVKAERDQWYQQTLEHQAKLNRLMIESGK